MALHASELAKLEECKDFLEAEFLGLILWPYYSTSFAWIA